MWLNEIWLFQKHLLRVSKLKLLQFGMLSSVPKACEYHSVTFIFIIRCETLIYEYYAVYDGVSVSSVT
jgi:hypothetical protein